MLPASKPKLRPNELINRLDAKGFILERGLSVVGIRGYYKDSMGVPGQNDRGIYDDALFLLDNTGLFLPFNGNTDPSSYRKGIGKGYRKGMASLKPGYYRSHRLGLHKNTYTALVQTAGPVTVVRDGENGDYEDTGFFGINIHRGGKNTTSSEGCQTLAFDQYTAFISVVEKELKENKQDVVPYILLEE